MNAAVRTRFAPSPTGFLHLGNVRTALFNALAVRRDGGMLVLRIEDSDAERSRPEFTEALCEDLRWLGVDWQEGPYAQSARTALYAEYIDRLDAAGCVYPCFCTPAELAESRRAQLAAGKPPRYAGTCAALSPAEVEARLERGLEAALRFRVPRGVSVTFDDVVRGTQTFASDAIGDFVIRRADGTPAFFFCNAVDDAVMNVTLVLRGEDHLANTPRQLLLLQALDLAPPRYGHVGLLVGGDGAPLSKRHGSASLRDLRTEGFLPGALANYLARLGHSYADDPGYADFNALAAGFSLDRLGGSPAHFDRAQLLHWQKEAVMRAGDDELWTWMAAAGPAGEVEATVPAAERVDFVQAVRDNMTLPGDALAWARAFYADDCDRDAAADEAINTAGAAFFDAALAALAPDVDLKTWVGRVGDAVGVRGKKLYMPLRAALTGRTHGPEFARVWRLLGPARVRARLESALEHSEPS